MARRPTVSVKRISPKQAKGYAYVRPNPGVRAIASINGKGAYGERSARSAMSGLTPAQKRARAKRVVRNATTAKKEVKMRRIRRNASGTGYRARKRVSVSVPRVISRGGKKAGTQRKVYFRAPPGKKTMTLIAKNRRRRSAAKKKTVAKRRRTRVVRRNPAPRKKTRKVVANRKRRVVRRRRAAAPRKRRVVANRKRRAAPRKRRAATTRRRSTVRRKRPALRRNRRVVRKRPATRRRPAARRRIRRNGIMKAFRRNGTKGIAAWARTGTLIAVGVIGHKFLTGFLKNLMVANNASVEADPSVEAEVEGECPGGVCGLGFLPSGLVPYAGIIAGAASAAAGVFLVSKTVKNAETRQLIAGGMVASFMHTLIVDLLKKTAPTFAGSLAGMSGGPGAARLSAMYGVGASIQPMYSNIGSGMGEYFSSGVNGVGEYFSSGVNGLGAIPSYEAAAGMGEYFSSGVNGLGEYGSNPDMMQAAAGYGALDAGSNSNHLDPSSNLDRELSIAEAAAGVGSVGPMQAAAGLGSIRTLPAAQTWIPGESNPGIWAGVRPVDQSQQATAMIAAGTLQSGGGQGIFG